MFNLHQFGDQARACNFCERTMKAWLEFGEHLFEHIILELDIQNCSPSMKY